MGSTNGTRKREKAITVGLVRRETSRRDVDEHLDELNQLLETAGGEVVARVVANRKSPDPSTWIGSGKAGEIQALVDRHGAALVVFDDDLSPAQVRNLEKIVAAKVVDRSGLILDIFARRARTREARTQVELAQLNYLLPRLTRQWSHLSRQAGGIGTRGVGETQLEIDRRIIRTRIARLREELSKIERNRETQRKARRNVFTVALVGYTNAGKSTLFNQLTRGDVEAIDQLFATLDAKVQKMHFAMPRPTVVIDTVGFIRKLPHHLVASFRSTMEEAVSADLVLHLIDASHPQAEEQRAIGNEVLADLGIDPANVLEVYNKIDRLEEGYLPGISRAGAVAVSALRGTGIARLVEAIRERAMRDGATLHLEIPFDQSRLIAELHEVAEVYEESTVDGSLHVVAWVPRQRLHRFDRFAAGEMEAAGTH
ncbi:MAG TPA: GTPase HflX [Thermoanaerobaculia bacterium]|nr:GTPase HflX [Thermoanaerobaculia bacterium]